MSGKRRINRKKTSKASDRQAKGARKGSALLWVLAASITVGAASLAMLSLSRNVATRTKQEVRRVSDFYAVEREAERMRSHLIMAYLSPAMDQRISGKDFLRVVRQAYGLGAFIGGVQSPDPDATTVKIHENTQQVPATQCYTYQMFTDENLRYQPASPHVRVTITATSDPTKMYNDNEAPWVEFIAEGPGDVDPADGKWKLLKDFPGSAGKLIPTHRILARVAFGQNKQIEGIPSVTRHAVLAERVSCMFCHLDVTGNIGCFENFRPGFDGDGSGDTARIHGTVFMTYKTWNDDDRNEHTTNSDGTSSVDYFPFAGVSYDQNDPYNPHWINNRNTRPDLATLFDHPQVINGTPIIPTGREDPNSITSVYYTYRNEGATYKVNHNWDGWRVRMYFPDSASGNQYRYQWADERGYATEAEANNRANTIMSTVPRDMLPEDQDNDGSPDFPTLKTTLMREWANGKILFGKDTSGRDGIPGTADDQLTIVHRPDFNNPNYYNDIGFYSKATDPTDPDHDANNETDDQTSVQSTTIYRNYVDENGNVVQEAEPVTGTGFVSIPNFENPLDSDSVYGNVVLVGTPDNPIVLEGNVFIDGDVIIKGYVTGKGTIYASRNLYVAGDLYSLNPPEAYDPYDERWGGRAPGTNGVDDPGQPGNPSVWAQQQIALNKDEVRLAARNTAIVGDYTHYDSPNHNRQNSSGQWKKYGQAGFEPEPINQFGQYNTGWESYWDRTSYNFLSSWDNLGRSIRTDRIGRNGANLDKSGKVYSEDDPSVYFYEYYDDQGQTVDKTDGSRDLRDYWVDLQHFWNAQPAPSEGVNNPRQVNLGSWSVIGPTSTTPPADAPGSSSWRYDVGVDVIPNDEYQYIGLYVYTTPSADMTEMYNRVKSLRKCYKYYVPGHWHSSSGGGYEGGTGGSSTWVPGYWTRSQYRSRTYTEKADGFDATYDNSYYISSGSDGQSGAVQRYDANIAPTYAVPKNFDPDQTHAWTVAWISDADYRRVMGVHTATVEYRDNNGDPVTTKIDETNNDEISSPLTYESPGIKDYAVRLQTRYAFQTWRMNQEFDAEWDGGLSSDNWKSGSYQTANEFIDILKTDGWKQRAGDHTDRSGHEGDYRAGSDFMTMERYDTWQEGSQHNYNFWPNQGATPDNGWRAVFDRNGSDQDVVEAFFADYGVHKHRNVNAAGGGGDNNSYIDFMNSGAAIYNIPNRMNKLNEKAVWLGWPDQDMDRKPDLKDIDGDGWVVAKIVDPEDGTVSYKRYYTDSNGIADLSQAPVAVTDPVTEKIGAIEAYDIRTLRDKQDGQNTPVLSPFNYREGYSPVLTQPQNVDAFVYANRRVGAVSTAGNSNLRIFGGLAGRYVAFLNDASYNGMFRSSLWDSLGSDSGANAPAQEMLDYFNYQDETYWANALNPGSRQNPAHNGIRWIPSTDEDGNPVMRKMRIGNAYGKDMTKMVVDYDFRLTEDGHQGVDGLGDQLISVPVGWTLYWVKINH